MGTADGTFYEFRGLADNNKKLSSHEGVKIGFSIESKSFLCHSEQREESVNVSILAIW